MKTLKRYLILFIIISAIPSNVISKNYYVKQSGSNALGGTNWLTAWQTIGHAVSNISPNDVVIVSNGNYTNSISIVNKTNISIISYPWIISQDNKNAVLQSTTGADILNLNNSKNVSITGFTINGNKGGFPPSHGIYINNNSSYNIIKNNIICSNWDTGIGIDSSYNNSIYSNNIFEQQGFGAQDGIQIGNNSKNNIIFNNTIFKHKEGNHNGIICGTTCFSNVIYNNTLYSNGTGMQLDGRRNAVYKNNLFQNETAGLYILGLTNIIYNNICTLNTNGMIIGNGNNNIIYQNIITNNNTAGILISDAIFGGTPENNIINSNRIYNNNNYGIVIFGSKADNNQILSNLIYDQATGIFITNGDQNIISYNNKIFGNTQNGIYISGSSTNTVIYKNNITNNGTGIKITGSSYTTNSMYNNIYSNTTNIAGTSAHSVDLLNNWFGSSVYTNIKKGIFGTMINFVPYRLLTAVDTAAGADTFAPDIVTGLYSYKTNGLSYLCWTKVTNSDLDHYNIYINSVSGFSNITPSNLYKKTYLTNIVIPPLYKTNHIFITASDNYPVYTNESWYSTEIIITNTNIITLVPTEIADYQTTINRTNQSVIGFQYFNLNNKSMTNLSLTNLYDMTANQDLEAALKIYNDFGSEGVFNIGDDIFLGYLYWSSSQNKWTNVNLSITNNSKILVTMDILTTAASGHKMKASVVKVQDTSGTNFYGNGAVTGPNATIDDTAPLFTGNFKAELNNNNLLFTWDSASDNVTPQNLIVYKIYKEQSMNSGLTSASLITVVTGVNTATVKNSDIAEQYYLILAEDEIKNHTVNPNEASINIKSSSETLKNIIIGPNPYKPNDNNLNTGTSDSGIIFDRLTAKATIRIYSVSGKLIETLRESDGDGKYVWSVPTDIASGVYLCVVTNPAGEKEIRKIIIIK